MALSSKVYKPQKFCYFLQYGLVTKRFPYFSCFYTNTKISSKKNSKSYQSWCRYILLSEKPGYYITNDGGNFEDSEAELKDFVLNSEYCPELIKKEFEESQQEDVEKPTEEESEDEDQLMVSPLQNSDEETIIPSQF